MTIMVWEEYEIKRPMSPLQRLYNIEKTLFPDIEK